MTKVIEITPEYLESQGLSSTFPERFMSKVLFTETHWLWQGSTRPAGKNWPKGHGMIQRREGINCKIYAHRAAWILFHGPIPEDRMVLHVCPGGPNPGCVNPAHLKLGDSFENMQQMTAEGNNYFANHIGVDHPKAKLTLEQVQHIKNRTDWPHGSVSALAREWGVKPACIFAIKEGRNHRKTGA